MYFVFLVLDLVLRVSWVTLVSPSYWQVRSNRAVQRTCTHLNNLFAQRISVSPVPSQCILSPSSRLSEGLSGALDDWKTSRYITRRITGHVSPCLPRSSRP